MKREEAIKYGTEWLKDEYLDAKDGAFITIALEALKQKPILDKIRAEIMELDYGIENVNCDYNDITHTICREEVLRIIDKHKKESEVNNG